MNGSVASGNQSVAGGSVSLHSSPSQDFIEISPATRKVLDACKSVGGHPILVGGCVRDALRAQITGAPVDGKDVDIEVYGVSGASLWNSLSALDGIHIGEDGTALGVYKVQLDGEEFDVSMPRKDNKTGRGHNSFSVEINPDMSYREAFARRDYTINSMGFDPETGELIDPYGGQEDLEAGILRHTSESFDEDPLRVLRGIQFIARFDFEFAPETVEKARSLSGEFEHLSKQNLWREFSKLTGKGVHISKALNALHEVDWERHFPTYAATRGVPQDPRWHPEGDVITHLGLAGDAAVQIAQRDGLTSHDRGMLVLASIVHDLGKAEHTQIHESGRISSIGHAEGGVEPVHQFLKDIGAPKEYFQRILPLVHDHMCHVANESAEVPSNVQVRRLIRRLDFPNGGPTIQEWARLVEADKSGRGPGSYNGKRTTKAWLDVAEKLGNERANIVLLKGQHLIEMGMRPSTTFQFIVKAGIEAQDNDLFNDEAGAVEWFKANRAEVVATAEAQAAAKKVEEARIREETATALKEKNRLEKIARREAKANGVVV